MSREHHLGADPTRAGGYPVRHTSRDGLMTSSDPSAVAQWDEICQRAETEQARWSAFLRELGVRLEHPDDGWVHPTLPRGERRDGVLGLSWYARFNDEPGVGDLIALGAPYDLPYRLVRVTEIQRGRFLIPWTKYRFIDTGRRVPEPPAQPPWWKRLSCIGKNR